MYLSIFKNAVTALAMSATMVGAHELTDWQKKSKTKIMSLLKQEFGGHPFGAGIIDFEAKKMNKYYSKKFGKHHEIPIGNLSPNNLKTLINGRTMVMQVLAPGRSGNDWEFKNIMSDGVIIEHYGKNFSMMCALSMKRGKLKNEIEAQGVWRARGTVQEVGGSQILNLPGESYMKEYLNSVTPAAVLIYDRNSGRIGNYIWADKAPHFKTGVIQDGIPQFAVDHCENFAALKNAKVNKDQLVFNTEEFFNKKTNKHIATKAAKTLFEQRVEAPVTSKHIYFDVTQNQIDQWATY